MLNLGCLRISDYTGTLQGQPIRLDTPKPCLLWLRLADTPVHIGMMQKRGDRYEGQVMLNGAWVAIVAIPTVKSEFVVSLSNDLGKRD